MPLTQPARKRIAPADSWNLLWSGPVERAFRHAKRSFAAARAANDVAAMASSLGQIAMACGLLGKPGPGLECALAARRLARRGADRGEEARLAAVEAFLLFDMGMSDEGFEAADAAVALATDLPDVSILAFASCMRGVALVLCRQPELALPTIRDSIRIAEQCGDRNKLPFYMTCLGYCLFSLSDLALASKDAVAATSWLEQAIETSDDAAVLAAEVDNLWALRVALSNAAEFYARSGDLDLAERRLERWREVRGRPETSLKIQYLYTVADVLTRRGRLPEAAQAGASALRLATGSRQIDHQVNAAAKLSETFEAMGDFEAALGMHRRFHDLYVRLSGETTQRRAKVAEIRLETERLRARADELANQALRDGLTGIANRRAFDAEMAQAHGKQLAIAMLDLDHFKAINDRHSHLVGDEVLRRLARVLGRRVGNSAFRLGGEEFAVVLTGADCQHSAQICEDLRQAIEQEAWEELAQGLGVTVSIGVAQGAGEHATRLLADADKRLYAAKGAGRNRVVAEDDGVLPLRRSS